MSDAEPPDETPEQPARRPSPSSRARRIGGRPSSQTAGRPSPGPAQATPDADATSSGASGSPNTPPSPAAAVTKLPPEPGAKPHREPSGLPRWIPAGILGVAVIALLAVLVVVSHGVYWAKPDDSVSARAAKQEQVLAAAKKCFATVNTYDYRKLTGLVNTDLPCTTGGFKTDLKEALTKTILTQAPKAKAVQSAQVNRAGVISVSPDGSQWVTLIYAQLVVSNSTTAKAAPRTDLVGAVVTMNHVGGKWLISKVGFDAGNGLGG